MNSYWIKLKRKRKRKEKLTDPKPLTFGSVYKCIKNNSKGIPQGGIKEQNKTIKQPQLVINKTVIKLHAFMPISGCIKLKTNGIKSQVKNQILMEMSATFILNLRLQSSLHTLKCVTPKIK